MADAPDPVTSPPAQGFQPYDAAASGSGDAQSAPATVYAAAGGSGADPWVKVQGAGAADFSTGHVTGGWPGNGTSATGPWKQV